MLITPIKVRPTLMCVVYTIKRGLSVKQASCA